MQKIHTKSFVLATYSKGDENADRIALVLPGRLDTKDYPHMRSHVDFLASQGFFALSFDPPGTWGSDGDINLYTTTYLKAINELIEYFGNKPTLLMGHSRGGSLAMLGAIVNPNVTHFVAVMSYAGASEPSKPLKPGETLTSYRDVPGHPDQKKVFEVPYSFFEDSKQYDIIGGLKKCTKPKLFFAGSRDTLVEPKDVQEAFDAAAEPKRMVTIDSDHSYRHHPELIEKINIVVGDFLQKSAK